MMNIGWGDEYKWSMMMILMVMVIMIMMMMVIFNIKPEKSEGGCNEGESGV